MARLRPWPPGQRLVARQTRGKEFVSGKDCYPRSNSAGRLDYCILEDNLHCLEELCFDLTTSHSSCHTQDLSDDQWRSFRSNLIPLALVLGAFAGINSLCRKYYPALQSGVALALSLGYLGGLGEWAAVESSIDREYDDLDAHV